MQTLEFEAEVQGTTLTLPDSFAARFPKGVKARVILLMDEGSGEASWRRASYQQFLHDDTEADSVYDRLS